MWPKPIFPSPLKDILVSTLYNYMPQRYIEEISTAGSTAKPHAAKTDVAIRKISKEWWILLSISKTIKINGWNEFQYL